MKHPERLARLGREVDEVPEPAHVLEVQVLRIVKIHIRLRRAVDQQDPPRGPISVPQELGRAGVDLRVVDQFAGTLG